MARGGAWLAVPTPGKVVVVSKDGVHRLPVRAPRRCDIVFPIGPRAALRLTDPTGNRRWPTTLQRSTTSGWKTIQRLPVPRRGHCRRAVVLDSWSRPPLYGLIGAYVEHTAKFVRIDGRWRVRIQ